ncbi:hypothetical protein SDC9_148295 [bioreactor metagenome]|uniref:Uncharacterized protein n=1 Tax=bioreactor metagenome TaxID=1076179 RepID=A0A645EIJ9_9ZZZZ
MLGRRGRPDAVHVRDRQAAKHPDDHHGRHLGAPRLIASDADRRSELAIGPLIAGLERPMDPQIAVLGYPVGPRQDLG